MTTQETENLIIRIKRKTANRFPGRSGRKAFKRMKRIIKLMRSEAGRYHEYQMRNHDILNSLFPNRDRKWVPFFQRTGKRRIQLRNFSFVDSPIETIEALSNIVEAEANCKNVWIDFIDPFCLDIGPYVVLGLMRQHMAPVFSGGKITNTVADAIDAVQLRSLLRMKKFLPREERYTRPFPMRSRRQQGTSKNDNLPYAVSSDEKVCQDFVLTLDEWLADLPRPLQLTASAKKSIVDLLGEILDNAKRHSDIVDRDGQWHIAGFMQKIAVDDADPDYFCNVAIVSPGNTIYESLMSGPPDILEVINDYVEMHKGERPVETLWNTCALQDGISRIDTEETRGVGMMTAMVSLLSFLFDSPNQQLRPTMNIISGRSCVMVKYPYNTVGSRENGSRFMALNETNDLALPPDEKSVFSLPVKFPGTLISMRFALDQKHMDLITGEEQ